MRLFTPATGTASSYTYNADGLRAGATTGKSTTGFGWDDRGSAPVLLTAGSTSYVYGPGDLPLAQISGTGTVTWLHHDQHGDTRLLTSTTGAVTGSYTYSPYGQATHTGTASTALQYGGGYTDPTGLVYLQQRYYDPGSGQFLSRDPALALTGQPYQYDDNNPIDGIDPTGLCGTWGWIDGDCEARAVGHAAVATATWAYHHPAEAIGIAAGVLAAATGVGALADTAILGIEASTLGLVSAYSGAVAGAADVPSCLQGVASSCIGAAANFLGAGVGWASKFAGEGTILGGQLSARGFEIGTGATAWDVASLFRDSEPQHAVSGTTTWQGIQSCPS